MNNEDYVSYELALKLKACGFDEPCDKWIASKSFSYYDEDECCDHNAVIRKGWLISQKQKERYDQDALPYLTLWQAQKWLKDRKGIYAYCEPNRLKKWFARAIDIDKNEDLLFDGEMFDNFEKATEYAIFTALELIKEGE